MKRTAIAASLLALSRPSLAATAEQARWAGVDERVVERFATEAGRHPWRTLLDGSGDLPLFLFLCAGIAGGFVLGYGWRSLFAERRGRTGEDQ